MTDSKITQLSKGVIWKDTPEGLRAFIRDPATGLDTPVTWAPQPGSQEAALSCPIGEVLYEGTRGPGKRVANETRVLTDRGWKQACQVSYEDKLVAEDGTYCNILGIFPSESKPLYNVEFFNGTIIEADLEHRWKALSGRNGYRDGWLIRTTNELLESSDTWTIPYLQGPIPGKLWSGPDPYMIGYIIANGTTGSKNVTIYSADEEILEYAKIKHQWFRYKYEENVERATCPQATDDSWRKILGHETAHTKKIPKDLLEADAETRLALLQGLMDGDGGCEHGAVSRYSSVSLQLANDVCYLVKSLAGWASVTKQYCNTEIKGYKNCGYIYIVNISHHNKFNPFRLKRKANRWEKQKTKLSRGIKSIKYSRQGKGVCFSINHPSQCFVIEDFVITHNTDWLLMDFAQHVGQGYGAEWQGVIFRQTFPELKDIINKSFKWFYSIWKKGVEVDYNKADHTWTWASGEQLAFRHFEHKDDYWKYHGHAYPFIGWEELTTWHSADCYLSMLSCNRSPLRGIPLKIRATTNPYGPGHNWVKSRWRLPIPHNRIVGPIIKDSINLAGDLELPRVAIRGYLAENKVLLSADPNYVQQLKSAASNPAELRAWLYGDWNIVAGGMFDDLWNPRIHVVPALPYKLIPKRWRIDRSYDHGSSKPFSVGFWAQSNGEPITYNGRVYGAVRGDLYRIAEWYGWNGRENEGVKMGAFDIAEGIKDRIEDWGLTGRVRPGPADTSIFDEYERNKSVAGDFQRKHVRWEKADKGPGSRRQGWEQMRKMLKAAFPTVAGIREEPGLFIFDCCTQFIRTVPILPRDKTNVDDVDTNVEDHAGDETRYRIRRKSTAVKRGTF